MERTQNSKLLLPAARIEPECCQWPLVTDTGLSGNQSNPIPQLNVFITSDCPDKDLFLNQFDDGQSVNLIMNKGNVFLGSQSNPIPQLNVFITSDCPD